MRPSLERSVVFSSPRRGGVLLLHVREQRLDAGSAGDRVVLLELDLRSDAQAKLARDARTKMRGNAVETVEGCLLLGVATQYAHVDTRVPKIGTDFRTCHSNESDNSRILCRFCEEGGYLDADRFGDAVRSTRVTQKRPPRK